MSERYTNPAFMEKVAAIETITVDNFFIKSTGTFTEVEKLPDGLELNFESKTSTYYVNPEKTQLWRVSDHWGLRIRECAWFLRGYKHITSFQWKKVYGTGMKIGTIAFTDLRPNTIRHKKDKAPKVRVTTPKPEVKVWPAPTMQSCVFTRMGFCRTQISVGGRIQGQCGIRENSFAHEVCVRMFKENREMEIEKENMRDRRRQKKMELKTSFMTTEADDYNSRR